MIRISLLVWVALAGAVGLGLFQIKHVVQEMDEELARLNRRIAEEHQAIHVLRAEWSHVNRPPLLEGFARRHLDLVPMRPEQMARISDLPLRAEAMPATVPRLDTPRRANPGSATPTPTPTRPVAVTTPGAR